MELFDTHCHIHEAVEKFQGDSGRRWQQRTEPATPDEIIAAAHEAGVRRMICVGTTLADSTLAIEFVQNRDNCWASIGIHPHEANKHLEITTALEEFTALATKPKVVAVGECGLDYYYNHSPRSEQIKVLEYQLDLAQTHNLPVIFHVRDAFDDFWPIFDNFKGLSGVIHSFTSDTQVLDQVLSRGLYVGLNGIMTFTSDDSQLAAAKAVPLESLLLETDAPFLTPAPYRGTICEPKHVAVTAEFLSKLRGEFVEMLSRTTSDNARQLFNV